MDIISLNRYINRWHPRKTTFHVRFGIEMHLNRLWSIEQTMKRLLTTSPVA